MVDMDRVSEQCTFDERCGELIEKLGRLPADSPILLDVRDELKKLLESAREPATVFQEKVD